MATDPRFLTPFAAALCLAAAVGSTASDARAEMKIGVVDVQYAFTHTEDGIRVQSTFKRRFDKRQNDLDARQADLAKMREDIEKQTRILSRNALERRMEDWQRRMIDLQTTYVEHNKALQKEQGELTSPIMQKLIRTIGRVAKKSGYDLIIDAQGVPYVRSDLNLTDQVIQLYNGGGAGDDAGGDDKKEEKKEEKKPDAPENKDKAP